MPDQRHITCCSLVEKNLEGVPNVISAFGLDTVEKRISFLDDYTRLFFSSFIPPLLNGLAYEAHGQNTILRVDNDGKILGFSIRDFGGVRVHYEAVEKATGIKVVLREGSAIVAHDMNDAYTVFFHSGIQQHIHRLVRALGLHYDASGWNIVRKNLCPLIEGTELTQFWFKPTIDVKCLFSMRMEGLYRDVSFFYLFIYF
jgi:siderophore synthetase component